MQTYDLYGGDVKLTFDEASHKYTVNGQVIKDSISGCLKIIAKPALVGWAAGLAVDHISARMFPGMVLDEIIIKDLTKGAKTAYRKKTEDAADLGTMGHSWVEDYLTAQMAGESWPLPVNPELRNIANTFLQFMRDNDVEVLAVEQKVYSKQLDIAGTFDCLAKFNGELAILDWKTGSGIYPEYFLQMGGYNICYTEEQQEILRVKEGRSFLSGDYNPYYKMPALHVIVNCSKSGDLKVAVSKEVERDRKAFATALSLYRVMSDVEEDLKVTKG